MGNEEKVWNYIKAKKDENKNNSFDINITDMAKELNLNTIDITSILEKFQIEIKLRFTKNLVSKQTYHKASNFPNVITIFEVYD